MQSTEANDFLSTLLNTRLHVHTTDTRMFVGEFKCTDNESNIILSKAYEYRHPSPHALANKAARTSTRASGPTVKLDMTSRFVGLIVVPGEYVTRIEIESQGG